MESKMTRPEERLLLDVVALAERPGMRAIERLAEHAAEMLKQEQLAMPQRPKRAKCDLCGVEVQAQTVRGLATWKHPFDSSARPEGTMPCSRESSLVMADDVVPL